MHMLRVGQVRRMLSASPAYLQQRGEPLTLSDLRDHDLIATEDEIEPHRDRAVARSGRAPRLSVNNKEAAISAAVAGLGIVETMSYQIADDLAAGRLKRVLVEEPAPTLPISLLFQSGHKERSSLRAFVEVARRRLNSVSL
jgi:DNA-binding transcriptional LysR family regulator